MAGNAPNLGQRGIGSGVPSGSRAPVQQGQGLANAGRGGPSPVNLAKHTQGRSGKVTVNSQPAKR